MIKHLANALLASSSPRALSRHLIANGLSPGLISMLHQNGHVEDFLFDEAHPAEFLRGRTAPDSVVSAAICFEGSGFSARGMDDESFLVVETLNVSGLGQSLLMASDDVLCCETPEGLIPDSLARLFGLATPPPDFGTSDIWLFVWLAELLRSDLVLDLKAVLRAHPAIEADEVEAAMHHPFEFVANRHRELCAVAGWSEAFADALGGRFLLDDMPVACHADWFDLGSFARATVAAISGPLSTMAELEPELVHTAESLIE